MISSNTLLLSTVSQHQVRNLKSNNCPCRSSSLKQFTVSFLEMRRFPKQRAQRRFEVLGNQGRRQVKIKKVKNNYPAGIMQLIHFTESAIFVQLTAINFPSSFCLCAVNVAGKDKCLWIISDQNMEALAP